MSAVAVPAVAGAPQRRGRGNALGQTWRLARADVLERTRRPAYAVSLLAMAWLAHGMLPDASAGYRTFSMHRDFRPAYGPEWVGTIVGVMSALYFLMVGFYLVKGAVERDRATGVGQILASTRVGRAGYLAGKALSNFVVLASMLVVALGVALATQRLLGEDLRFDPLATALPLFALALPVAAVVAAGAVLVECVPGLAGGAGNVVWFVLSIAVLSMGALDSEHGRIGRADLLGVSAVTQSTYDTLHALHPDVAVNLKELNIGVNVSPEWRNRPAQTFPWRGLEWNAAQLAARALWLAIAAVLVALAALVFDRFERPAVARGARAGGPGAWLARRFARPERAVLVRPVADLPLARRGHGFAGLVRAELALLLHARPWAWWLGAAGMLVACAFAPLTAVRAGLLPVLAIWPLLLVSDLGARERRHGTEALLFSAPRPVSRQLAAAWLAGAIVCAGLGATALPRLLAAGDVASAAGWLVGGALVPALALALGAWTGGGKFFEVLLLFAWYVGPMHHIAELDWTGVTAPRSPALWLAYVALLAGALAAAWAGRARRVRGG